MYQTIPNSMENAFSLQGCPFPSFLNRQYDNATGLTASWTPTLAHNSTQGSYLCRVVLHASSFPNTSAPSDFKLFP